MPDFAQPVTLSFVFTSIAIIFIFIGVGIALVKMGKKSRNPEG